jgi:hypothetical protein
MITLSASAVPFKTPDDSVEQIYSAVENNQFNGKITNFVCYRTKDGFTHQAEVNDDGSFTIRKSVPKMK